MEVIPVGRESGKLSTSRVSRGGAVARVAVGQISRSVGTQVSSLGQPRDVRRSRSEQSAIAAAEQLVNVLGSMKGGAAKIGQMLSMVDMSSLPRAYREPFQERLSSLCDAVPEVEFRQMRREMETSLGARLSVVFSDFDPDPVGSASIGQVYRATLRDGRDVAVKVKYPGIDQAVRADIKNLTAFLWFWRRVLPTVSTKAFIREVRDALENELAYETEAVNQHRVARMYRDHPFAYVPDSLAEYSSSNVLVTEWCDGVRFDPAGERDQAERDRLGEILFRFYVGGIYRNREFCADPHLGNVLLRGDGTVGFIDFGAYKFMSPAEIAVEKDVWRAAVDNDAQRLSNSLSEHGLITPDWSPDPALLVEYAAHAYGWQTRDEVTNVRGVEEAIFQMFDPRAEEFGDFRRYLFPPAHLASRRVDLFTTTMLRGLDASANWYAISAEWMADADPATELGHGEKEWADSRRGR
ncbi:hypothetical protein GOHSU_30_00320 [Gordonia hirsuta DSM 44140 = NBRC 16056]|uniref:ABC1 atypical kinase-like domain-containing protein n=1 Tax=Gordonia hirsuta DSM 44140 = NBRC 16056 TaxID=1121927 RepID=L7LDJ1_9ACTN|nr:hypothetical protein GOHSU_30_00320 [Gordonia hirsuta DSM 44140 = NBRC 16056]